MADTPKEPNMDDILASIRRIIAADDDEDAPPRASRPIGRRPPPQTLDWTAVETDDEAEAETPDDLDPAFRNVGWPEYDPEPNSGYALSSRREAAGPFESRSGPARRDPPEAETMLEAPDLSAPQETPEADLDAALRQIERRMGTQDPREETDSIEAAIARFESGRFSKPSRAAEPEPEPQPQDDQAFVAGLDATDIDDAVRRAKARAADAAEASIAQAFEDDDEEEEETDVIELTERLNEDGSVTPLRLPAPPPRRRGAESEIATLGALVRNAVAREHGVRHDSDVVSPETEEKTVSALAKLEGAAPERLHGSMPVSDDPDAPTIEEMVRQTLRPLLREWVEDNMPSMVERIVREEIERMSARARRFRRAEEER